MIKILVLIIFTSINSFAHDHVPSKTDHDKDAEINLRLIKRLSPYSYIFDLKFRHQFTNSLFSQFRAGFLYRLNKNWKAGAFVELSSGNRHSEDWQLEKPGDWHWEETQSRLETTVTADLTYRKRFLKRFIFEVKNRLSQNTYNNQTFLRVRPGVNYFFLSSLKKPIWNLMLQAEYYFPLNYGETTIYEKWYYLSSLYHYDRNIKFGPFIAYKWIRWDESQAFKDKSSDTYTAQFNAVIFGFNILYIY